MPVFLAAPPVPGGYLVVVYRADGRTVAEGRVTLVAASSGPSLSPDGPL